MNWKYVAGYEERYKVYENGDVFEGDNKVDPIVHKKFGTLFIFLIDSEKRANISLAKLIYETFIEKIKRDYVITPIPINFGKYGIVNRYTLLIYYSIYIQIAV